MNSKAKAAALVLLALPIAGCRHKAKATPPPAAQAPIAPVSTLAKETTPPQLPPPELPKVGPPAPATTAPKQKPHKTVHHKPKTPETTDQSPAKDQPATAPAATPVPPTEQAANGAPADISPIGQLSAAGESTNTPRRHELLDEINSTETGLNGIKRTLTTEEQTTVTQIRTFLAKAKYALNQEDLDGANTLVTKAKVLLAELTKP